MLLLLMMLMVQAAKLSVGHQPCSSSGSSSSRRCRHCSFRPRHGRPGRNSEGRGSQAPKKQQQQR
jgi:hypothetical protein